MTNPAFDLYQPARVTTSVVFASPHSGRHYPASLLRESVLDAHLIRSSEDAFVDTLFDQAPLHGAPLLAARVPRAYVDLNRSIDELDPAVVDGVRRNGHNPRVASGLGVIPRVVANGRAIYRGKLSLAEARARLDSCWLPYHAALQGQLDQAHQLFGEAILIDCHSMPREALDCVVRTGARRPDVVLGDRFGASAAAPVVDEIEAILTRVGLTVARNAPFAGAYVTQQYGRPSRRQHAVQLEIDRSLYMDEARITPRPDFEDFRAVIGQAIAEMTEIGRALPLAAE
ncbi:N-formylglutamate amidohydrolase [Pseudooceanicola onchidii]|uniref:N-formylglutamate amidohydrolase n=1 Tax=Pseudooceanicola onchidii TaxID=2562279 RepID=UPI0010AA954D|nr:N-formylglutamate amidohydrolase [Pseudooceanicola onchidii]